MRKFFNVENRIEIFLLTVMTVLLATLSYILNVGNEITFLDSDDYMRVIRIQEFFQHFDLNNHIIERCNSPFGGELHWSRFYDFFLIGFSYVLGFFTTTIQDAIIYVCFCIAPLIKILTTIVIFQIIKQYMNKKDAFLTACLFTASPIVMQHFSFGRPDHHAIIALFIFLYILSVQKIAYNKFQNMRDFLLAGVVAAINVWISPETLIALLPIDVVLLVFMMRKKYDIQNLYLKNGITTLVIFSIIVFPALEECYDKISIVHYYLYLFGAVLLKIIVKNQQKSTKLLATISCLAAIIVGVSFVYCFPYFLNGMEGNLSPYIKEIWLSKIFEMQSPFIIGGKLKDYFIFSLCFVIAACASKLCTLKGAIFAEKNFLWIVLIVLSIIYTLCSCFAYRMFSMMIAISIPLTTSMLLYHTNTLKRLISLTITILLNVLPIIFINGICINNKTNACTTMTYQQIFPKLNDIIKSPSVIMANTNMGPYILFYSHHSVVGSNYHRQLFGIHASYKVMEADYDESTVKRIIKNTNASYILVAKIKSCTNKSLSKMAFDGNIPNWLSKVELPLCFKHLILLKVKKN